MAARNSKTRFYSFQFAAVAIVIVIVGIVIWSQQSDAVVLVMDPIPRHDILEGETVNVKPTVLLNGTSAKGVRFRIVKGPPGAKVSARTGEFTWKAEENHGGKNYGVDLQAQLANNPSARAEQHFTIAVKEVNDPPVIISPSNYSVVAGETMLLEIVASDPDVPPRPLEYRFGKTVPAGASLDPIRGQFEWTVPANSQEHDESADIIVSESSGKDKLKSEITLKIHVTKAATKPTQ